MKFKDRMKTFEAARDVSDNYNKGKIQYDFKLLPEGRKLGLTPSDVGRTGTGCIFRSSGNEAIA
jgi:hypothetical protein